MTVEILFVKQFACGAKKRTVSDLLDFGRVNPKIVRSNSGRVALHTDNGFGACQVQVGRRARALGTTEPGGALVD